MKRLIASVAFLVLGASAGWANADVNRLVDAMGLPALLQAFSAEGERSSQAINDGFLNGQGGDVWAETVRRLYDPARLEQELRTALVDTLDSDIAAQALLFFDSDLGQRIIELEVQARQAFLNEDLEAAAKSAPTATSDAVTDFLAARDLIQRNADTAMTAQAAFFDGLLTATGQGDTAPDLDAQRDAIVAETESWLRGYYALAQSPLSADDIAIYTAFWKTDVGQALDDALFSAFADSYATLSFGLGQAAGRLLPQNDL